MTFFTHRYLLISAVALALGLGLLFAQSAAAVPAGSHPCHPNRVNVITGTQAPDHLTGTPCADAIYGFGGADVLIGRAGVDVLAGGPGRDRLLGVDGEPDRLRGGRGRDYCKGDQFDTFVSCERIFRVIVA